MQQSPSLMSRYKWSLILAVLLLVSLPLQVLLALSLYNSKPGHAFVTPGSVTFNLTDTGNYTLWVSSQEVVNDQLVAFAPDVPSGMAFALVRDADQAEIPLLPSMTKTVTINKTKRTGYLVADIQQPGQYTITSIGSAEPRVFYFSKDFVFKFVSVILCSSCTSFVLFIGMLATAVYALVNKPAPEMVVQDELAPAERVD